MSAVPPDQSSRRPVTRSVGQRGRHRKPSTANRTLAKTALAGAVVGAPLVTVGQAEAAPDNTWDQVAKCESGGNWSTNTGNGFQGGLQFTQSTWRSFGGTAFASSANKASREQQIAVAEKVLAGQGWNAWPVCSRKAGARGSSATPRVITVKAPAKSGTSKSAGTKTDSAKKDTGTTGTATTHTATTGTAKSVGSKPAASATPVPSATGKHALKPAPKTNPLNQPSGLPGVHNPLTPMPDPLLAMPHAAPGPLTEVAEPTPAAGTPTAVPAQRTYQVRPGDTLSSIATAQRVSGGWQGIYQANKGTVSDANRIKPGQTLTLS